MVKRVCAAAVAASFLLALSACSPKQMALNRMAAALASASTVYENDNDPEFVRLAAPSTLKTVEMLLKDAPNNTRLLLTVCSGFTQYSYGFLHVEAEVRAQDATAEELKSRAAKMYQRARGYCLRGLEVRRPGLTLAALADDPAAALKGTTIEDVPWLYWTAAAWGAELSLAPNQLLRVDRARDRACAAQPRQDPRRKVGKRGDPRSADRVRRVAAAARRIAGRGARGFRSRDGVVGQEIGVRLRRAGGDDRRIRRRSGGCSSRRWRSTRRRWRRGG